MDNFDPDEIYDEGQAAARAAREQGDLDAIDAEVDAVPDEHIEQRLRELLADPPHRSVFRELLTPDQIRHLEVSEGRFFLPGPPP